MKRLLVICSLVLPLIAVAADAEQLPAEARFALTVSFYKGEIKSNKQLITWAIAMSERGADIHNDDDVENADLRAQIDQFGSACQVKGKIGAKEGGKFPVDVTFSYAVPKKLSDHLEYQIAATRTVTNVAPGHSARVRLGQESEKNPIWAELTIEQIKGEPIGISHPPPPAQR